MATKPLIQNDPFILDLWRILFLMTLCSKLEMKHFKERLFKVPAFSFFFNC